MSTTTTSSSGAVDLEPRHRGHEMFSLVARLFLAGVLIWAGAVKVGKPLTSERAVQAFEIFPYDLAGWIGVALPFAEIALGVLLLLGLFTRPVAAVSTVLMLAFVVGIAQAWARGLTIDCGCFGGGGQVAADQTQYPQDIARDLVFAAAGAWLWRHPRSLASLDRLLFGR
ncbi:MAG: MauE/DoxX family redox-associated membrane protein [Dermatophilaceae bacterium]